MKTTNLLNEKLELVTEISSLKMALNKQLGPELTGCKVRCTLYLNCLVVRQRTQNVGLLKACVGQN